MSAFDRRHTLGGALLTALLLSCSTSSSPSTGAAPTNIPAPPNVQPPPTSLFAPNVKTVNIEIDYATGAEPYVGKAGEFADVWELFRTSTLAIFDGKKTLSFPNKVSQMQKLDDVTAQEFTSANLLDIAATHRDQIPGGDVSTFYVVFLNGYYKDDEGTVQKDIIGKSVADTGVIGIFKPAIATLYSTKNPIGQYVEQLALIHELGHAVGFVNNGVPVNTSHEDTTHGSHCTNKGCVMGFAVETVQGASQYAQKYIIGDGVLYGQECLSDARILETKLLK